jgi:hypothetical protein
VEGEVIANRHSSENFDGEHLSHHFYPKSMTEIAKAAMKPPILH